MLNFLSYTVSMLYFKKGNINQKRPKNVRAVFEIKKEIQTNSFLYLNF